MKKKESFFEETLPKSRPRHAINLSNLVAKDKEDVIICREHKYRSIWLWEKEVIIEKCVRCGKEKNELLR